MIQRKGPFEIINNTYTRPAIFSSIIPRRRYNCPNYCTCLNIAAALSWDSFTCRGCCGELNKSILWKAYLATKKDKIANRICKFDSLKDPLEKKAC
ncbi:MAG: hypothetical protein D6780_00910 [Candidatus Dadabacteria bacterium]|nr:MAG: hypothetical protein D6780_00910 [Candidatus Dadabacteria bacterium]